MKITSLTILLVISLLLVGWIELSMFPFININFGDANKINALIVNFSLAYISSYFFYYIVVYLKEKKDASNSIGYILQQGNQIVAIGQGLKDKLVEVSGSSALPQKEEELRHILIPFRPGETVKNHGRLFDLTWENYFKEISNNSRYSIDRILPLMPYLDSRLLKILTAIYDCQFISLSTSIAHSSLLSQLPVQINLSLYSKYIIDYFNLIDELQLYIQRNTKAQKKG